MEEDSLFWGDDNTGKQHRYLTRISQSQETNTMSAAFKTILMVSAIVDEDTGESLEYCNLIKQEKYSDIWMKSFANELGWLAQGLRSRVEGTNTIYFIPYSEILNVRHKDVIHGRIVVDYRSQKEEQHHTRITVGRDRLNYPGGVSTPTALTTTAKLL